MGTGFAAEADAKGPSAMFGPTGFENEEEGEQGMKSIKKFLMLGILAAMTAFCLAPGFALADEGGGAS